MTTPTFGSLFAGIGGFDLGLERSGWCCKWQVEIDPFARRVLAKHWPDVRRHDDVRTFPPTCAICFPRRGQGGSGDAAGAGCDCVARDYGCTLICGGFPCQDISNAGRRAGIDGDRSGLWSEFARVIGVVRPRFALVENSAALLGRGMGRVLGDLANCGYDAEWDCLPCAAFGAVHIRTRVFLLAYPNGQRPACWGNRPLGRLECSEGIEEEDCRRIGGGNGDSWRHVHDAYRRRRGTPQETVFAGRGGIELSDWWASEPGVGRVAHDVPGRVDRCRVLGNAVVPIVAEWIGRLLLTYATK